MEDLKLTETIIAYSHNSYDSGSYSWPEHDISSQLNMGIRALEFDIWDNQGRIAHDSFTVAPHVKDVKESFEIIADWSYHNPGHVPLILMFELTDNGTLVEEVDKRETELAPRKINIQKKVNFLATVLNKYNMNKKIISYRESLQSVNQLRDKFLVTIFRKFNTPYFRNRRDGYSARQTLSVTDALELAKNTEIGENYMKLLIDNNIFLMPRYLGKENPDHWNFTDPDYLGMLALEESAGLRDNMLRILKQDNRNYTALEFTENTYMISGAQNKDFSKVYNDVKSLANAIGADNIEELNRDPKIQRILKSKGIICRI